MKKILTALLTIIALTVSGQTSEEHMRNGMAKHRQRDFEGAIKDYDKSIKEDRANKTAYFNRGTCKLVMKDRKSAMEDFTKTIELDDKYAIAYFSRATILVDQERYDEALPDLDKAIELDPTIPSALVLRGQIRAMAGNITGACQDFHYAKQNGNTKADKFIVEYCNNPKVAESLKLDWTLIGDWKIGDDQENAEQHIIDLIHSNEKIDNWTELANMTTMKAVTNIPIDKAMGIMYDQAKANSPKAKLTFIEKDESAEFPWIIFSIEAPEFKNAKTAESQVWYIVQGKQALYSNFIAFKKATLPAELKKKWTNFFKTGKVENEKISD